LAGMRAVAWGFRYTANYSVLVAKPVTRQQATPMTDSAYSSAGTGENFAVLVPGNSACGPRLDPANPNQIDHPATDQEPT